MKKNKKPLNKKVLYRFFKENNLFNNNFLDLIKISDKDSLNICAYSISGFIYSRWMSFIRNNIFFPILLKFLNDNQIKDKYFYNVEHYPQMNFEMLKFYSPMNYINLPFLWKKTNEGELFWYNISSKWIKYINPIYNNKF